ncbi:MAG: polyprenol monophosphomannose synthase [Bacteroidales bacterium OttesenSCG-928-I14]|nr:polyprenol monophosphomannose synthase [Bacteroidales bacterium OttesenSCG-928-I14]
MKNCSDSVVIIPTYNEEENIEKIIRKIFSLPKSFDVLVVDDCSSDSTAIIVKSLQKEFCTCLHLLERIGKKGLGTSYIAGFKWVLKYNYDYIFEMDADFSHNPDDLIRLYQECFKGEADLVIGSRYIVGINVINWPMSRVLLSYIASKYVRFISGLKIRDTTAGFKCYKRKVLEQVSLDDVCFKGYAFQIGMKYIAWTNGFTLKEIPIVFINRTEGTSKMNKSIFTEAFFGIIWLRLNNFLKKIFLLK